MLPSEMGLIRGAELKLSRREQEVGDLVAEGLTNHQIAERLSISKRTAEYHVEQILNKLGFHSRSQVAVWVTARARGTDGAMSPAKPPRHNLPSQLTSFVGRKRELQELKRIRRQARLVTLTGPAGIGKTRLALEVAAGVVGDYRDG